MEYVETNTESVETMHYIAAFNWLSMLFAFAAAALWYVSAVVRVKALPEGQGRGHPEIIVQGNAFIATAHRQALWNRWGAGAAATAALFQGLEMLVASLAGAA